MKFKAGDKVRCIDFTTNFKDCEGTSNGHAKWRNSLNPSSIYTISKVNSTGIILENEDYGYSPSAFELVEDTIPKYIQYLGETSSHCIKNRVYKVKSWEENTVWVLCNLKCANYNAGISLCMDSLFNNPNKYKIATEDDYNAQIKPEEPTTEEDKLLEEAKRRYPVGTKIRSSLTPSCTKIIESSNFYWYHNTDIVADTECGISVYTKGRWAEVIETPKEEFKAGDWVVWIDSQDKDPYRIHRIVSEREWYVEYKGDICKYSTPCSQIIRKATPEEIASVTSSEKDMWKTPNVLDLGPLANAFGIKASDLVSWNNWKETVFDEDNKRNLLKVDTSEVVVKRTPVKLINDLF